MQKLKTNEILEHKLNEYKSQLVVIKNKIEKSPEILKADVKADIDSIELMLAKVKEQISQFEYLTSEKCNDMKETLKYEWNDISIAIKSTISKILH